MQGAGAVYVFARDSSGQWAQEAYIKPSNTAAFGDFGKSVALDGNSLVVGAAKIPMLVGSAYVFTRAAAVPGVSRPSSRHRILSRMADSLIHWPCRATRWQSVRSCIPAFSACAAPCTSFAPGHQLERGRAAEGLEHGARRQFRNRVALSGDTLAVGACQQAGFSGAVYVFDRTVAGSWAETAIYQSVPHRTAGHVWLRGRAVGRLAGSGGGQ